MIECDWANACQIYFRWSLKGGKMAASPHCYTIYTESPAYSYHCDGIEESNICWFWSGAEMPSTRWYLNFPTSWYSDKIWYCCSTVLCTEYDLYWSILCYVLALGAIARNLHTVTMNSIIWFIEDHIVKVSDRVAPADIQVMHNLIQHFTVAVSGILHYSQCTNAWGSNIWAFHNSQYCTCLRAWVNACCRVHSIEEPQNRVVIGVRNRAVCNSRVNCIRIASKGDSETLSKYYTPAYW